MKVVVLMFLILAVQSRALRIPTKQVEVESFSTPSQNVSPIQEKPAEIVQVNDSQTSPGKDRLPYVAIVVELELEKTGTLRETFGIDQIAAVSAIPIDAVYQPPGPPERTSNKKGSYIATVSYGPNSPSLVYTCYSNNEVEASILNSPNAVQGPYGYVCTVVKGRPGVVTDVHTVQEPNLPPVIQGAVEIPAESENPQQPSVSVPTVSSASNSTQGNVYLKPQTPGQSSYYYIKGN